uniref:Uncharacterized protein n=1 Tax=Pseudomonas savastanoi pv. savastanoi TaxID=360920 RepID=H1ZX44_PSESS|nr:hypothetical protein PSPSV_C0019 [Pseudomonas savastanoi pv. savastanoi]
METDKQSTPLYPVVLGHSTSKTIKRLSVAFVTALWCASACAVSLSHSQSRSLLKQESILNDACRGGSGDDPNTMRACDERDKIVNQLHQSGWCYGKPNDPSYLRTWAPCGTAPVTDLPRIANENFKAFRDAMVSERCIALGVLPPEANSAAYKRMQSLDPLGAQLIDANRGSIAVYLGDDLSKQLENSLQALNVMDAKSLRTTCKFTNLRNLTGGPNPSVNDAVRAAPR